jgi:hypothetical protein
MFLEELAVNVRMGIFNNELVGSFILPIRFNSNNYFIFLQTDVENYLDNIPLLTRIRQ